MNGICLVGIARYRGYDDEYRGYEASYEGYDAHLDGCCGYALSWNKSFINCPSKVGMYKKGECECDNIKKDSSVNWSEEETLKII